MIAGMAIGVAKHRRFTKRSLEFRLGGGFGDA
jgi:hypothetical protein